MCLLVTQNSTSPVLSNEWLSDFHSSNSDGVGVMYVKDNQLIIEKTLPKTAQDFIEFYHEHIKGKNCAYHLRMKTHGDIDLTNCHPYEVLNSADHGLDIWLMHNGVLSTGNKADTSKSDTWHYIRDYLRPMLIDNPDFAFHPSFSEIVGSHIGSSNKFVLMDNKGRQTVINQKSGVYWAGLWLSNTYAWSASKSAGDKPVTSAKEAKKQAKEKPQKYSSIKSSYSSYKAWDDYYDGEYVGMRGSSYNYYEDEDEAKQSYFADDYEIAIDEMGIMELFKAQSVTFKEAQDFAQTFDEGSFFDLAYSCIDGDIDEDTFIKCMENHDFAKECFPFLNRLTDLSYAQDCEAVQ